MLSAGCVHPTLLDNVGNIALLQRAQAVGLLPAPVGEEAAQTYRQLRQLQHQARLDEAPTQVPAEEATEQHNAGMVLWHQVFGA